MEWHKSITSRDIMDIASLRSSEYTVERFLSIWNLTDAPKDVVQ